MIYRDSIIKLFCTNYSFFTFAVNRDWDWRVYGLSRYVLLLHPLLYLSSHLPMHMGANMQMSWLAIQTGLYLAIWQCVCHVRSLLLTISLLPKYGLAELLLNLDLVTIIMDCCYLWESKIPFNPMEIEVGKVVQLSPISCQFDLLLYSPDPESWHR